MDQITRLTLLATAGGCCASASELVKVETPASQPHLDPVVAQLVGIAEACLAMVSPTAPPVNHTPPTAPKKP